MKTELVDVKKGATWQNIYDTLWHIATVRYVTREQLKNAFPEKVWRKKCVTPKKLNILIEKQFLNQFENGALTLTAKGLKLLKEYSNYNSNIIRLPQGKGEKDTLYNTNVLLQAIQLPDFYALFYPEFYENKTDNQPFLVPDGALVLKREQKAKLIFLEIEREKPDWQNHLEDKKWKYEVLAEKKETWQVWWWNSCKKIKLMHCPINEFGFTVWCIGNKLLTHDWSGWEFDTRISEQVVNSPQLASQRYLYD